MLHLYCLTSPGGERAASGVRGLEGAPVRVVRAGAVEAWVSEHETLPREVTPDLARAHDGVVRAAMAWETPLPARYGQTFANEESLTSALAAREGAIVEALERVRGAVEMTVRVLLDEDPAEEGAEERGERAAPLAALGWAGAGEGEAASGAGARARTGRDYLSSVRARHEREAALHRRAEFLQARLSRAVEGVTRGESRTPAPPSSRFLTVSHLVALGDVSEYRLALRSFVESEPRPRVLVSGPWAPYSFTENQRG
ncbi:MAG TPA: GvpL/GvpF family gas vesicle protein [Gemmatimonadaceae bacterium]